jgi:major membrane immunogen (membrane-anchored lipoprotein)
MLRNKVVAVALAATLALGALAGCGSKEASGGTLKDGVYKVEYEAFDTHGYKPQLEVTVAGGKITAAKYDEVMQDGSFKSKDAKYNEKMKEGSKTNPEKAFPELVQQIVTKQSAEVDGVSGATASSTTFKALAKKAVEMAKKGDTAPAKISGK